MQALLRPLFITSWLIHDFLAVNAFFGARAQDAALLRGVMLLSNASSKTAYGTVFQLAQREGIEVVGLTSPGNVAFCKSLDCHHRVLRYDQLDLIDAQKAAVYIDFAGNADLRRAVHTRFVGLKYSSSIGGTHAEQLGGSKDLPGPKATLYFAPAQAVYEHVPGVVTRAWDMCCRFNCRWGCHPSPRAAKAGLGNGCTPPWVQRPHHNLCVSGGLSWPV